jgi:Methane oxygenase PmoA
MERKDQMQSKYEIRKTMQAPQFGQFVASGDRILGAVGHDSQRSWIYPLFTPRGLGVTQECSFDHTFHRSIFVGQGGVVANGRRTNFWCLNPDYRHGDNEVYRNLGTIVYGSEPDRKETAKGFSFSYHSKWLDTAKEPIIAETRTIDLYDAGDATVCDVTSEKTSASCSVTYTQSKYGSIGVRVQPQLLPAFGGRILALQDGVVSAGLADEVANDKDCDWVAYQAELDGIGAFGVALMVLRNTASTSETGPWFIRDYGMAMFNATMHEAIEVPEVHTWTAALRVVAYDGEFTPERAGNWRNLER